VWCCCRGAAIAWVGKCVIGLTINGYWLLCFAVEETYVGLPDTVSQQAGGFHEAGAKTSGHTGAVKDKCTAFVSNLDYAVAADQIREIFCKVRAHSFKRNTAAAANYVVCQCGSLLLTDLGPIWFVETEASFGFKFCCSNGMHETIPIVIYCQKENDYISKTNDFASYKSVPVTVSYTCIKYIYKYKYIYTKCIYLCRINTSYFLVLILST